MVAAGNGPAPGVEACLPHRLDLLSSVVSRVVAHVYARHGLKLSEWLVLMTLGEGGPMTAKTLGVKNRMNKTTVSRAVAALLARELIAQAANPVDLRQSFYSLTPPGRQLYDGYAPLMTDVGRRLEEAVPEADRAALERCLVKLAARSEQLMADPKLVGSQERSP
jgi:DNA-binding MarR family transcriptional regulator